MKYLLVLLFSCVAFIFVFSETISAQGTYECRAQIYDESPLLGECVPGPSQCDEGYRVPFENACDDYFELDHDHPFDIAIRGGECKDQTPFECEQIVSDDNDNEENEEQMCRLTSGLNCVACQPGDYECTFESCAACEEYRNNNEDQVALYVCAGDGTGTCLIAGRNEYAYKTHYTTSTECELSCPVGLKDPPPASTTCNPNTGKLDPKGEGINTAIGCIPFSPTGLAKFFLGWALGIGGGIALLMIGWASIIIMTSSGDPKKVQGGKELLTAAVSGLLLMIFSTFILRFFGITLFEIF